VVRVIVTTPDTRPADHAFVKESFGILRANGSKSSQTHKHGNQMEFIAAPITDLDKLAEQFAPGKTSAKIDAATRTIHIELPAQ
jgi:hypothetical protein